MIIHMELEEISSYLRQNANHTNYQYLLSKSKTVQVTKMELKKIEEQFYIEQANLKLAAVENSHSLTDKELKTMRWSRVKFETFDGITKKDVSEF